MSYFGAPPGRKCNCGNEAKYVAPPSTFRPFACLLCDECGARPDGMEFEVKTMEYPGEIPLSVWEATYAVGREARRKRDQQIIDAIFNEDGAA